MADEISPRRLGGKRVSRTSTAGAKRASRGKKSGRMTGMKAVDTIPRLEDYPSDNSESAAIEKMMSGEWPAELNGSAYADDLGRIMAFVEGLPLTQKGSGIEGGLLEECFKILQEEFKNAREVAAARKVMPRA